MNKKVIVFLLIIFISLVATFTGSYSEKNNKEQEKEPEVKEVVFEDFELKENKPRSEYRQYKYYGPGNVLMAEKIFIEYLAKEGWDYDYKEEEFGHNNIYFNNQRYINKLKLIVGSYGLNETLVIIEEPYQ